MKKIGLIGGMSWQSTAIYYKHMNEIAQERLGNLHSADLLLHSLDFADIAERQHKDDWSGLGDYLAQSARGLELAGAAAIVICTNTMHLLAEQVQAAVSIPLIHIADATASAIKATGSKKPALLATKFTMEKDFYTGRLSERHGISACIPDQDGRDKIHHIIYEELCKGLIRKESKEIYIDEVTKLKYSGADGVILGCTEITMLVSRRDFDIPVFDTTWLHSKAAMDFALSE